MILLKHLWYKYKLTHLIHKEEQCTDIQIKKEINKKIYALHVKLNNIELDTTVLPENEKYYQ